MRTNKIKKNNRKQNSYFAVIFFLIFNFNSFCQNIQNTLIETWTNGNWQNSMTLSNTYDSNQYLTNYLIKTWDTNSNTWKNSNQYNYVNNSLGNPTQLIIQNWDVSNTWVNSQKYVYTYNSNNKIITNLIQTWTNGNWQNSMTLSNTYDSNQYLTNYLIKTWDTNSNTWKNSNQYNYVNNSLGNSTQLIIQNWDVSNTWVNSQKYVYTYNSNNKKITNLIQTWTNGNWQNSMTLSNTYDSNQYLTNYLIKTWDTNSNTWKNSNQYNYVNNSLGNPTQLIIQNWDVSNTWVNSQKYTYNYVPALSVENFNFEKRIIAYPNPANDIITITTSNDNESVFYIIDQSGKIIKSGILSMVDTNINIEALPKGIYFIKINKQNVKFIKE